MNELSCDFVDTIARPVSETQPLGLGVGVFNVLQCKDRDKNCRLMSLDSLVSSPMSCGIQAHETHSSHILVQQCTSHEQSHHHTNTPFSNNGINLTKRAVRYYSDFVEHKGPTGFKGEITLLPQRTTTKVRVESHLSSLVVVISIE